MGTLSGVSRFVTTMMGIVIGLTFLFGFGNVLALALRIGVPVYVAPLVAPAVDLTVLGLLVGTRHLAMQGAPDQVLRPARRLLLAASMVTLALNVADPIYAGEWGKAAFDAVGPLLLIGWAEVGPALLGGLQVARARPELPARSGDDSIGAGVSPAEVPRYDNSLRGGPRPELSQEKTDEALDRARTLNLEHWVLHKRPISAETLRRELRIGAARSRALCAVVREEVRVP